MNNIHDININKLETKYRIPTFTEDGEKRNVDIRFTITGVTMVAISNVLLDVFGGQFKWHSDISGEVQSSVTGTMSIALDKNSVADFHHYKYAGSKQPVPTDSDRTKIGHTIEKLAETFVSWEVSITALPVIELYRLKHVTEKLRSLGAVGAVEAGESDFRMDLAIELPDKDLCTLRDYVRSFCCLHSWLRIQERNTRDLLDYKPSSSLTENTLLRLVSSNSDTTAEELLKTTHQMEELRDSGLVINADHTDHREFPNEPKLHYQMAVCDIDNPDWSLTSPWSNWLMVEKLANSHKLENVCDMFLNRMLNLFPDIDKPWIEAVQSELEDAA